MQDYQLSKAMSLNLLILLALLSFLSSGAIATVAPPQALPGCSDRCGNVSIPYPFGVERGCYKDYGYLITCQAGNDGIHKAYRGTSNTEVFELSLDGKAKFKSIYHASECFNYSGYRNTSTSEGYWVNMENSPFWFSPTNNKFTAIGCDAIATISDFIDNDFMSGCTSVCTNQLSVRNGSCSGIGCCQTSIPRGLKRFNVTVNSKYNHTMTLPFNPCSFAFLADQDWYTFRISDLSVHTLEISNIPMVMDWAIGNKTCEEAEQDADESYACGPNTSCSNSTNGPGYRCYCKDGFEGNPYLYQGCQDINECEGGHNNSCYETAICHNTFGNYSCSCPKGYHGDGWKDGTRCTQDLKAVPFLKIIACTAAGLVGLSAFIWFLYWAIQRKRREREKFFQQNGGLLLQQQIASNKGAKNIAMIFSSKALKKATNNFHESQVIGQGGFGTVYKGTLSSGKVVAIKKSKIVDKGQILQFINEVDILSQINHRHVVKLLGCCLETEVPLLVYEFISNGTLSEHIHSKKQAPNLSWKNRLRIAAETSDALAYLHSSHAIPVLHRDVKSSNILLDDKYRAKVSDFGASRLVPIDETQKMTVIQGTHGYLDPECLLTGQLTDKSDVYSFGVVLLELLTGKKPLLFEESGECTTLVSYFLSSMNDGNLFHIIDDRIITDGKREQFLTIAELARDCVEAKREDRPTMKEVAKELDSLKLFYEESLIQHNQETEPFLGEQRRSSTEAAFEVEIGYSLTDDDLSSGIR